MSSYRKGKKSTLSRSSRSCKKRFQGNQFTSKANDSVGESASAKKLASASGEDVHWNSLHDYRIMEFFTVFTALSELVICRES